MTKNVGGVVGVIGDQDQSAIEFLIDELAGRVPEGRLFFLLWQVSHEWNKSLPIETIFINHLLGDPTKRSSETWVFYGNGVSRMYSETNQIAETWMWAACRRAGDKAYFRLRSGSVSEEVKQSSEIPVSHPVFTRDVANNVWHLPVANGIDRIISRIQALTTWSDEVVLVSNGNKTSRRKHKVLECDSDLVPVAEKILYEVPGMVLAVPKNLSGKRPQELSLF